MAKITYQDHQGSERTVEVETGLSVMQGALHNMVAGIDADCGGACSCATCMVYVPVEWADRLPPKDITEAAMLDFLPLADATSRLSCQMTVTDEMDGLRVRMPESQQNVG